MRKPWDRTMKRLLNAAPQDFVEWLLAEAIFIGVISTELDPETDPIYADLLFEVLLLGQRMLLHIEFQRRRDTKMAERLWEYNHKATLQYNCPVWSAVIYLKDDGNVPNSPLIKELPNGQGVHRFDYGVTKLWEKATAELEHMGLVGLLPLLPLTREGAQREVVERTITSLMPVGEQPRQDLLTLTYGLASLAFENEADQQWLKRRFEMLYDMLRDTPAFQDIMKEGLEQGLERGREEGLEQGLERGREEGLEQGLERGRKEGHNEALRQALLAIVQARFPSPRMIRQAKGQAAIIDDPAVLQDLIVKVSLAESAEEAERYLLDWPSFDNQQN
jgi:predicted transposase YdaD